MTDLSQSVTGKWRILASRLPGKSWLLGAAGKFLYPDAVSCIKLPPVTVNLITIVGLAAAFCTTISFLPQAIKTIRTKDTSSISLSMYALFAFGTLLWFLYGLFSSNLPVSLANGVTLVFATIILVYKLRYK